LHITSDQAICRIVIKFGVDVVYQKLLNKRKFREKRLNDSLALLNTLNELLSVLPALLDHL
jgi:hypothetical protein